MKKAVLLLFICNLFVMSAQELALANKDGKYGYINTKGEWVIQPNFKFAKGFSRDFAIALEGKKHGFIKRNGEWLIEPIFDKAKDFNSGVAVVLKNKRWFYINTKGEEVLKDVETDKIYDFINGVAFIRIEKKIGLIDINGKVIVPPKFDKIKKFRNGYAKFLENGKWGLIDTKGAYFVPPSYDAISNVSNGMSVAKIGETNGLIVNGKFKEIPEVQKIWEFNKHSKFTYAKKADKVGFINSNGDWIVEPVYDKVRSFKNGLAPVCINKKWGYIDASGKEVIALQFRDAELFSTDGLAPVKIDKLWGFIDVKGNLVIKDEYIITTGGMSLFKKNVEKGFINGLARVKYKKKWGFINTSGNVLNDTWFINLEDFK